MRKKGEKIGTPFYALTTQDMRQWYQDRLITATGYLLSIKRVSSLEGKNFTIPCVREFCKEWGIGKSAFYKAVNDLRTKGYLDWESTGGIILKDSSKVEPMDTRPRMRTPVHECGHLSTNADSESTNADSESTNADSESTNADSESTNADTSIYIDRAREDLLDLNRIKQNSVEKKLLPPTEVISAEVEVIEDPVSISSPEPEAELSNTLCDNNSSNSDRISAAALDPNLEKILEKYESGEIEHLPTQEKKQLSRYLFGDAIVAYRKSGWILSSRPDDINRDFLKYVAWKELKNPDDLGFARNTVCSYERDMAKWGQLNSLVEEWQTCDRSSLVNEAINRSNKPNATQQDKAIAIQYALDNYEQYLTS